MLRKFQFYVGDEMVAEDDNFFTVDTSIKALREEQVRKGTNKEVRVVTVTENGNNPRQAGKGQQR